MTSPQRTGLGLAAKVGVVGALAVVSLIVYVMARGFGTNPHEVPFMMNGAVAPEFSIKRLDTGETVTLSQFKGTPVVLNFWASWCGPCKQEHPVLEWGARQFKGRVVFLGIVFEDSEENTRRFLKENGWSLTQLFDPKSTVAVDFGVAGVPETYFIKKDGTILGKYAAPLDEILLGARISDIVDDPALQGTIQAGLKMVAAAQLKTIDTSTERGQLLVKGLAAQGMSADEILATARQIDLQESKAGPR